MTAYHGPERRSSVSISGPAGVRVVVVGPWAVFALLVVAVLWLIVGVPRCPGISG